MTEFEDRRRAFGNRLCEVGQRDPGCGLMARCAAEETVGQLDRLMSISA